MVPTRLLEQGAGDLPDGYTIHGKTKLGDMIGAGSLRTNVRHISTACLPYLMCSPLDPD